MDLKEFEIYLKDFVPRYKTVDNLMKIAAYIQGKDFSFYRRFSLMRKYYFEVYGLDKSCFVFRFVMHDYLKEYFTAFAKVYGTEYIDTINEHFGA